MNISSLALFLLVSCSGLAWAEKPEAVVNADTAQKLAETKAAVEGEMAAGGRYEFITPEKRTQVEGLFRDMQGILDKSGSVAAMPEPDRLQLFNLREKLNGVLTGTDSQRLICEKKAPIGSLVPIKTCLTYGEIERKRRDKDRFFTETKKRSQSVRPEN